MSISFSESLNRCFSSVSRGRLKKKIVQCVLRFLLPAELFPSSQITDKFTKCVQDCEYLVRNTFQWLLHNPERDRTGKVMKTKWKPLTDQIWQRVNDMGETCFPSLPHFPLVTSTMGCERGMWVTVLKEGNINTCLHITVFLLPGELQLVNAEARQRHAAPQQAGSDLCMQQPGEKAEEHDQTCLRSWHLCRRTYHISG